MPASQVAVPDLILALELALPALSCLGLSPSLSIQRPSLHTLAARYREAKVAYDQFHADHINEILSEHRQTLAQLTAARADLDRQLAEIAQYHIASNEEAAAILALLFDVTGTLEDASNYRAAENILHFLRHDPPYDS